MPSKLEQMQQQLRLKLMQEKEEKLIKIYNNNQQKALNKLSKSNEVIQKNAQEEKSSSTLLTKKTSSVSISSHQNLTARRGKGSPGVDRSRPLAPIQRQQKISSSNNSPSNDLVSSSHIDDGFSSCSDFSKNFTGKSNKKLQNNIEEYRIKPKQTEMKQTDLYSTTKSKQQQIKDESIKSLNKHITETATRPKVNKAPPGKFTIHNNKSDSRSSKLMPSPSSVSNGNSLTSRNANRAIKKTMSSEPPPNTESCSLCKRYFAKDRIEKHKSICQKLAKKKRKTFDSTKMRVEGTEAENFVKNIPFKKEEPKAKKSNWRAQHEEFLQSIRQAKVVQKHLAAGGKLSDLPPPKPSENPDYVRCPHCNRRFNEGAASRHIPKCKNIISNKPKRK